MSDQRIIKISVFRESLDEKIGVSLRQEEEDGSSGSGILINTIAPDSLFAPTRLRPGMQVLKINDVSLIDDETMDLRRAMQLLKESQDLVVLEVREIIEPEQSRPASPLPAAPNPVTPSSSPVPSQQSPAPTTTTEPANRTEASTRIEVTPVRNDPSSIPSHQNDDRPVSIASTVDDPTGNNNDPSSSNLPVASAEILDEENHSDETNNHSTEYIDASHECVATPLTHATTISRILRNFIDANGIITVTATRPNHAAVGISLRKQSPKSPVGVFISSLKTFSIFNGTHLQPGMKILSVNGRECTTPAEAAQIMKQAQGEITLLARYVSDYITQNETTQENGLTVATVSVKKPYRQAKAGFSLRQESNGDITIVSINADSIFSGSHLKAGMKLLKINGVDITNKPVKDCGLILKEIAKEITLVAREYGRVDEEAVNEDGNSQEAEEGAKEEENDNNNEATATSATEKAAPNDSEQRTADQKSATNAEDSQPSKSKVVVDNGNDEVKEETRTGDADNKELQEDKEPDNTKCSKESSSPKEEDSSSDTSNEAAPEDDNNNTSPVARTATTAKKALSLGYSLAAAFIIKPHPTSELGISIGGKTLPDGTQIPVIVEIEPDGLCAGTDLEVGMRLLSVDGVGCRGAEDATKMLSQTQGDTVTILASLSWHMAFATVIKPTRDAKVGINMRRMGNFVVIKRLTSDGLFTKTGLLKEGMRVCCINGTDVDDLKEAEIAQLVSSAEGTVTVLAENLNHCLVD